MSAQTHLESLQCEISELETTIAPLERKLAFLRRWRDDLLGRAFVEGHKIRREDVEFSEGEGKPRFGHICGFVKWLCAHNTKDWAEWNTVIYRTEDLIAGRMPPMPADKSHLID